MDQLNLPPYKPDQPPSQNQKWSHTKDGVERSTWLEVVDMAVELCNDTSSKNDRYLERIKLVLSPVGEVGITAQLGQGAGAPKPRGRFDSINDEFGSEVLAVQIGLLIHLLDYRILPLEDLDQQLLHRRHLPPPAVRSQIVHRPMPQNLTPMAVRASVSDGEDSDVGDWCLNLNASTAYQKIVGLRLTIMASDVGRKSRVAGLFCEKPDKAGGRAQWRMRLVGEGQAYGCQAPFLLGVISNSPGLDALAAGGSPEMMGELFFSRKMKISSRKDNGEEREMSYQKYENV
ncbi:Rho guanine nucleotide exchange factor 2 [Striga asiatica]|uniref:Rho guanine nucleotide exchange factor 2 n=1 Tax=Striga asiatica TaxID=4170 RepID=A0A5A7PJ95_STRAF|nr:Rho guanine nucleotide exchange factor 2 [Striga asiatica]